MTEWFVSIGTNRKINILTWKEKRTSPAERRREYDRRQPRQGRENQARWGTFRKQRAEKWTSARVISKTAKNLIEVGPFGCSRAKKGQQNSRCISSSKTLSMAWWCQQTYLTATKIGCIKSAVKCKKIYAQRKIKILVEGFEAATFRLQKKKYDHRGNRNRDLPTNTNPYRHINRLSHASFYMHHNVERKITRKQKCSYL